MRPTRRVFAQARVVLCTGSGAVSAPTTATCGGGDAYLNSCDKSEKMMSPKELLYTALGSCTLETVRAFHSNSKQTSTSWRNSSLEKISVSVTEVLPPGEIHVPTALRIDIAMEGSNLTKDIRRRLLKAAEFCPVKRLLNVAHIELVDTTSD